MRRSRTEAEDIAQDSMLRAWRRRATLRDTDRAQVVAGDDRPQRGAARVRPQAARPARHDRVAEGGDDERVLATVERADLHAALERLNKRDRQLVRLRYDEDMTQEAIAHRLGILWGP